MKTFTRLLPLLLSTLVCGLVACARPSHPLKLGIKLRIDAPHTEARFAMGEPIQILATAVSDGDAVLALEFLADGHFIGISRINTFIPVPPGEPVHHEFLWKDAPVGIHVLAVRFIDAGGAITRSDSVKIIVVGKPPQEPTLTWTRPKEGAVLKTPGIIELAVTAVDPKGEIRRVEFYDGGLLLGVSEILTKEKTVPGRPRHHFLQWTNPPVGSHVLVAVAVASDHQGLKAPRRLTVVDVGSTLTWKQPSTGGRFPSGTPIELVVLARDPAGILTHAEFFAGDVHIGSGDWICPECRVARGAELPVPFVWKGASPGRHTLHAEAVTAAGERVVSPFVTISVDGAPPPAPVVRRRLPSGFVPGAAFTVTLEVTPKAGVQAYVVVDHPPFPRRGGAQPPPTIPRWTVTKVSGDGVYDAPNAAVKFGPFLDGKPRVLTYEITPNNAAVDRANFEGWFVADGTKFRIGGDTQLQGARRHPADSSPADNRISAEELTAYGSAWRLGKLWRGAAIPMDFVTRAGVLWRGGERYRFDPTAGPAPLWWVSDPFLPPANPSADASLAGTLESPAHGGVAYAVVTPGTDHADAILEVRLLPGPSSAAYALELTGAGELAEPSDGGHFDSTMGTIRWGPFTDGLARTVRCRLPASKAWAVTGQASFDGRNVAVLGNSAGHGDTGGLKLIGPIATDDGAMEMAVEDSAVGDGAVYELEFSADLIHWTRLGVFQPGAAAAFARDELPASDTPRFYRAVRTQ